MDPGLVGVILTGMSAILLGIGQLLEKTRFSRAGVREMRRRDRRSATQLQKAISHIVRLETTIAGAGLKVPRRPAELDPDWGLDDDDELAEKRAKTEVRAK